MKILATLMFPFYIIAYGIARMLKPQGYEDMPTIKEWFGIEGDENEN